eukprot:scaffold26743_cov105-Isochrysis_galbana.AAC.3
MKSTEPRRSSIKRISAALHGGCGSVEDVCSEAASEWLCGGLTTPPGVCASTSSASAGAGIVSICRQPTPADSSRKASRSKRSKIWPWQLRRASPRMSTSLAATEANGRRLCPLCSPITSWISLASATQREWASESRTQASRTDISGKTPCRIEGAWSCMKAAVRMHFSIRRTSAMFQRHGTARAGPRRFSWPPPPAAGGMTPRCDGATARGLLFPSFYFQLLIGSYAYLE